MDKRIFTIILAIVLIGCFFLPYISFMGHNISGLDIVTAKGGDWEKYIPALIPLSGLMLLIGALNNGNYPGGRGLWAWLPLLTLIFWIIAKPAIDGEPIKMVFKEIGKGYGIGLWATIAASVILAFYNPRSRV
jgi:hypothetical protein